MMMDRRDEGRLLSQRNFIGLIGIDYHILEQSQKGNFIKFYLTSALVILIFITSFGSIYYGFDLLFDMWHAELLLSLFFSFMFFNIYIFLIQTFSKEVFPSAVRLGFFNLSNLSRLGFVIMLGFILSQPIKVYLFRQQLDQEVMAYKQKLAINFSQSNQRLYQKEFQDLNSRRKQLQNQASVPIVKAQLMSINHQLTQIRQNILDQNRVAANEIEQSNFFIQRIKFAYHIPLAKLIELIIIALYCAPVLIIYSISKDHQYYQLKKKEESKLVIQHYLLFKSLYQQTFKRNYHIDVEIHENYLDPPFNTRKKPVPEYMDQEQFLEMIR